MGMIVEKARLVTLFSKDRNGYEEVESEDTLLKIFESKLPQEEIDKMLVENHSWPLLFHLSSTRKNLLNWYGFKKEGSLLEMGAGCGALTGLFCDRLKKVAAVEITKKRAQIIYKRYREKENLTVYAADINNLILEDKFDYVTSIGVLEYAGGSNSDDPFLDFVKKLKSFLKANGTLILAIENKFAFKYWSGVREDHTKKSFDSLEDYPDSKTPQTFSRKEIKKILSEAGFKDIYFYYPFPDHKLPVEIFSEEYLPSIRHNLIRDSYPYTDYSMSRDYLFNEKLVSDNLIRNEEFELFANSFLIFAR